MSEGEPVGGPDPELEAFYAAERARPLAPDAVRHAALARVLAAAPVVPPVSPGISRTAALGTALASLVLGAALGALGHAAWVRSLPVPRAPAPVPIEVPAPPEPPPVVAPASVVEEGAIEAEVDVEVEAASPSAHVGPTERASAAGDDGALAGEMALVARAQTALQRGLFTSALSALDEHARRFPRGELAEEREALAVQALARAGRHEEALRRAERFDARYPRSLLGPVVRAAVDGAP